MANVSRNYLIPLLVGSCGLWFFCIYPINDSHALAKAQSTPVSVEQIARTSPRQVVKEEDPYKNVGIKIEAFVVQIDMTNLYEMGVCPLSSESKSTSAKHIITCLKEGQAEIIAGAKLTLGQNEKGSAAQQTKESAKKSLPIHPPVTRRPAEGPSTSPNDEVAPQSDQPAVPRVRSTRPARPVPVRRTESHLISSTKRFSAYAKVDAQKIRTEWSFEMTNFEEPQTEQESMSNEIERNWSGTTTLTPGKPQIVAAVQDGNRATFLILTGNIEE